MYVNQLAGARLARTVVHTGLRAFLRIYCRLSVEGLEYVPLNGPFILAANHSSHADTAVLLSALPGSVRERTVAAAARDYFFDRGIRQQLSRILFNTIPVTRAPEQGEDPLRHLLRALREGYGLILFPEGTRSETGEIGPFRSGIGRLVAEVPGLSVIPVRLRGTRHVLPKGSVIPRPHPIRLCFSRPLFSLQAQPGDRATWRAVADQIRAAVMALGADSDRS